jgi:hypothetical protein
VPRSTFDQVRRFGSFRNKAKDSNAKIPSMKRLSGTQSRTAKQVSHGGPVP